MKSLNLLVVKSSKIQEIRALHALSELNIVLMVRQCDKLHFQRLIEIFDLKIQICEDGEGMSRDVMLSDSILKIDHKSPLTLLGSIRKPLIFPLRMFEFLNDRWESQRKYRISFCGLVTKGRMDVINHWLFTVLKLDSKLTSPGMFDKIKRKLYSLINKDHALVQSFGDFHILQSNRGRVFPMKTWDDEYYSFLLQSEFVLCPSGDYVWTYRFFEAIICGAIPIVEEVCEAYQGFLFYRMSDRNFSYNEQWVSHNFNLARERITMSDNERQVILEKFTLKKF